MIIDSDLNIKQLSPVNYPSPLLDDPRLTEVYDEFVAEDNRVRVDISSRPDGEAGNGDQSFERAGARRAIFFNPTRTRVAIVTCGGLCPGINDVIRALVMELHHWYGVREVLGIRYGYAGLVPDTPFPPVTLRPDDLEDIHLRGGTILGTSRGSQNPAAMVEMLGRHKINILFCIGGDGTLHGAHLIAQEVERRGLPIAVVGIPKTIDNDIALIYRCFGFKTAVEEACRVLDCAHVEAKGARSGVGLVKLMGRDSGFIAAHATLANGDVNFCLVPEIKFRLDGPRGFLSVLRQRLHERQHAVIAVAEGAGRDLVGQSGERDASGNIKMNDIGLYLKQEITAAFARWGEAANIRYFDPSYLIRSVPANSDDSIFCADLARYAVHAGMAGKTAMFVGYWHGIFTHVPLAAAAGQRRLIDLRSSLWRNVLATTGQPASWE